MNRVLATLAVLAGLGAAGGAAVVFGGLFDVSARAGHWPIVPWVLHTTYENSVRRRAPPPSEVPDLTDDLARLGARHFDAACRMCHASPGEARTATVEAMQPPPPHVTRAIAGWEARHLGWILREGVKYSGMPAWPAARDDEVWSVVAFLARVPEMDAATYAELTARPRVEGPSGLGYCAGCHGADGRSGNPHIPRLDIQEEAYLREQLAAYLSGARASGIMRQAATEVPPEALPALAAHFAGQRPTGEARPTDPALAATGRDLAFAATGDPLVPACAACHGPDGGADGGSLSAPVGPGPSLAGQYEAYLAIQLGLWRDGSRGGGPLAGLMVKAATDLSDADIAALAAYYAGLPPRDAVDGG